MTSGQQMIHSMIRQGPYMWCNEVATCGFCEGTDGHFPQCPWPAYVAGVLLTWPEWKADLNDVDQQVILDLKRGEMPAPIQGPVLPDAEEGDEVRWRDL